MPPQAVAQAIGMLFAQLGDVDSRVLLNGHRLLSRGGTACARPDSEPFRTPLLQALVRGTGKWQLLSSGSYGEVYRCWVEGYGMVAIKRSFRDPDAIRAEATINRLILPNPYIAQVGVLQHSVSALEGSVAACLSRGGTQQTLPGSGSVARVDAHSASCIKLLH